MRRDGGAGDGLMRDVNSPPGAILARSGAPDILCRMSLRRKILLAALMTACGTPEQQVATSTGITTVGEFHYIHHQPDGSAYADPNAMGSALISAARDVGMRITLLDTCYLASGFGTAPVGAQIRYSDGSAEAWATRVAALNEDAMTKVGAALHSVRAVPKNEMPTVVAAAQGKPLHVHLSEQVAENEACQAAHQQTPTQLLADVGALGINTSAVHATHLTQGDIALLGDSHTTSCFCPTTERDLGDGIGPSRELLAAGSPLSLGSDSHAVIDLFEEMRALEMNERLATQARGHWSGIELVEAATRHDSLGWADVGRIEVGAQADLVTISMTSPTTAGCAASYETVAMATSSYDVLAEQCVQRRQSQRASRSRGKQSVISSYLRLRGKLTCRPRETSGVASCHGTSVAA